MAMKIDEVCPPTTTGQRAQLWRTILIDIFGKEPNRLSMEIQLMVGRFLSTDFPELRNEKGKRSKSAIMKLVEADEMSEKTFNFLVFYVLNSKSIINTITITSANGMTSTHNIEIKRNGE